MFKLFVTLNIRLWWRSLRGIEFGAILFYSIFLLLILGQFVGIAITLLFAPEIGAVQEAYPWFTENVQLMLNLIFINMLWFTQLFFTKISRLRLNDNRKLLALGVPVKKLTVYLNLAGFFHPVNLLFNIIWLLYLGLMTNSFLQFFAVILLIVVNYGLINSFKWRFKLFSENNLKWVNGLLGISILTFIIFASSTDFRVYFEDPELISETINSWLKYSPGSLLLWLSSGGINKVVVWTTIVFLSILTKFLIQDLNDQSKQALLTPVSVAMSSEEHTNVNFFMRWLGQQGGKYFYSVWSHPYSKTQFLLTYVLIIPYIFVMNDGSSTGSYMVAVFLALIPILFLMVMLSNVFGFENRELLLSLQAPVAYATIIKERFISAFKITMIGLFTVMIFIPYFFQSFATMLQIFFGVLFINIVFLHYVLQSCINNYKKVENVSLMSVSNPIIPASITFTSMFMVLILGVITFIVFEEIQWIHILSLLTSTILLTYWFIKKFNRISEPFRSKVIPQLWNEL